MGGPALVTAELMRCWLRAQAPNVKALPAADAELVGRGKALFEDAKVGCATCHSGSMYTNNATVDVAARTACCKFPL
jgi:mono/diheme cytochrome c family protein